LVKIRFLGFPVRQLGVEWAVTAILSRVTTWSDSGSSKNAEAGSMMMGAAAGSAVGD